MCVIPRKTVSGTDLYVRSPEMHPEKMSLTTHQTSATSIRSMTALVAKLRARLASGASSGAGGGGGGGGELLLRAATYFAPTRGKVVLELNVLAPSREATAVTTTAAAGSPEGTAASARGSPSADARAPHASAAAAGAYEKAADASELVAAPMDVEASCHGDLAPDEMEMETETEVVALMDDQ